MAAATAEASRPLSALLCRSISALRQNLPPQTRLAALDITSTHTSIAISDRSLNLAYPFGVLARTALPAADARILNSALQQADTLDDTGSLDVSGLVIGISPDADTSSEVAKSMLNARLSDEDTDVLFPGLSAILFYSEAHAVKHAVDAQRDYVAAVSLLPPNLESRKLKRFTAAMNPKVPAEELIDDPQSRSKVSARELLQAVLDDLKRLPKE